MRAIITLLLSTVLLQGCWFIAGGAAGGALVYSERSTSTIGSDQTITFNANNALYKDSDIRGKTSLTVATYNGNVLLAGQAPTPELAARAENIVDRIKGVHRVYNDIEIGPNLSIADQSTDGWMTTKVKSDLLTTKTLDSGAIKVVTVNKVVYLMGRVTPQQADLAARTASQVKGVTKVVKLFELKPPR